jgi:hypothetical protein
LIFIRFSFQISSMNSNLEFGKPFSLICSGFYMPMAMIRFRQ